MNAITLPKDLEAWAEAEVLAGRAANLDEVAARAVEHYRRDREGAELRHSLDQAVREADAEGWLDAQTVFDGLIARLGTR